MDDNIYSILFKIDGFELGKINFGSILEHNIGNYFQLGKRYGSCKVLILNNEGSGHPHFHLFTSNNLIICCPMIFKPNYFNHEGKDGQLNENQLQIFDKFMSTYNPKYNMTNWEYGAKFWINKYGKPKDEDYSETQPDYTKMTNIR